MREQLEDELARAWTRENLAVYADLLQGDGDPRGEWIAMDLAMIRDGLDAATQQRREKLLQSLSAPGFYREAYGTAVLIHHQDDRQSATGNRKALYDSLARPLGRFVYALTIAAEPHEMGLLLDIVGRRRRPWLRRLTLVPVGDRRSSDLASEIHDDVIDRLATATPALRVLEVRDRDARFTTFRHPNQPQVVSRHITEPPKTSRLQIQVGAQVVQIELGRMIRLHLGIVDELGHAEREAWAELRFALEHLEDDLGELVDGTFDPVLLDAVIASAADVPFYGVDWQPLRALRKRTPDAAITIRRA